MAVPLLHYRKKKLDNSESSSAKGNIFILRNPCHISISDKFGFQMKNHFVEKFHQP